MWDTHKNKITEDMFLRDVRFDDMYILVTDVVYNTKLGGFGMHKSERGKWIGPYPLGLFSAASYEITQAAHVPEQVRIRLEQERDRHGNTN